MDHPESFGEEELGEDESETSDPTIGGVRPRKRQRTGGRVGKGKDFWSQVDAFFVQEITRLNSRTLTSASWKRSALTVHFHALHLTRPCSYVDRLMADDNSRFSCGPSVTTSVDGSPWEADKGTIVQEGSVSAPYSFQASFTDLSQIFIA